LQEANSNHIKTIQELQLEKARLAELNHKLGEEVQNVKDEVETIKQAKEDSIANAKRLVQECMNK
jgi:FtsZ-binding cell division protein ZapB